MGKKEKLLLSVTSGKQDKNILFADLCRLLEEIGFDSRTSGSHHMYYKDGVPELPNIQPDGDMAKPYQVKQVRELIKKYDLGVKK